MPEVEQQNGGFSPRVNTYLLGHEEEEKLLLNAWKNNKLHNSWLICGIEGIGKATLAYRFARVSAVGRRKQKRGLYFF